ncbi:MAG TPA: hypothetical protein ENN76_00915, partial [Euryarchaeota archaeon]|nr:hypothetical protein [Euryarchaeota archaeon]
TITVNITDLSQIDLGSILLYVNGFSVSFNMYYAPGGVRIEYFHEMGFTQGTVVCRVIASDIYGNTLDWQWQFDVYIDETPPFVVSHIPGDNVTDVPLDNTITIRFSKYMNQESVEQAFHIWPSINGTFVWSDMNVTFVPVTNFSVQTFYNVSILSTARDFNGYFMVSSYYWIFSTHDTLVPFHSNETPANGKSVDNLYPTVSICVSDISGINPASIKLYINGFMISYTLVPIENGYNVSYWHEMGFADGQSISCRIIADDVYGNRLDYVWTFTIQLPYIHMQHIKLTPGWNLISVAVETGGGVAPDIIFADQWSNITTIQYYNSDTKTWQAYDKNLPYWLVTLTLIKKSNGYWVYFDSNETGIINITGECPVSTDIQLLKGWNMVGYPSCQENRTLETVLAGIPWNMVEKQDNGMPYNLQPIYSLDYFEPGRGYWIHVSENCVWTVEW